MFEKRSLNWKMRAAFSVSALCLVVVGYFSYQGLQQVEEKYEHVANTNLPNAMLLGEMKGTSDKVMSLMIQSALVGNSEKEMKRLAGRFDETIKHYEEIDAEYRKVTFVPGEEELYKKVQASWEKVKKDMVKGRELATITKPEEKHLFGEYYMSKEVKDARFAYYDDIGKLVDFQKAQATMWVASARESNIFAERTIIALGVAGFLFSVFTGFFFSRAISKTLNHIAEVLAEGAREIAQTSSQVAGSSETLSSAVSEQAAAV